MNKKFLYTCALTLVFIVPQNSSAFLPELASSAFGWCVNTITNKVIKPCIEETVKICTITGVGFVAFVGTHIGLGLHKTNLNKILEAIKESGKAGFKIKINDNNPVGQKHITAGLISAIAMYITYKVVYPNNAVTQTDLKKTEENLTQKIDKNASKEDLEKSEKRLANQADKNKNDLEMKIETSKKQSILKINKVNKNIVNFSKTINSNTSDIKKIFIDLKNIDSLNQKNYSESKLWQNQKDLQFNGFERKINTIYSNTNDLKTILMFSSPIPEQKTYNQFNQLVINQKTREGLKKNFPQTPIPLNEPNILIVEKSLNPKIPKQFGILKDY